MARNIVIPPRSSRLSTTGWPDGPVDAVTRKKPCPMRTQVAIYRSDVFGVAPAALIVVLTILAMLGIVAAVATI
jgi:hypothetical protein